MFLKVGLFTSLIVSMFSQNLNLRLAEGEHHYINLDEPLLLANNRLRIRQF